MKARLIKDTKWFPLSATDISVVEAAGTVGTIGDCNCANHEWDYHFYPDRLTDDTFFGVFDSEVEFIEEEE